MARRRATSVDPAPPKRIGLGGVRLPSRIPRDPRTGPKDYEYEQTDVGSDNRDPRNKRSGNVDNEKSDVENNRTLSFSGLGSLPNYVYYLVIAISAWVVLR